MTDLQDGMYQPGTDPLKDTDMDLDKFRSPQARGSFAGNPEGYPVWAKWADRIRGDISVADRRHAHRSSGVPALEMSAIVSTCMQDPESALHVLVNDMLHSGSSWTALSVLREVAESCGAGYPDMSDIAGRFIPQVARVLEWYDGLREGFEPGVRLTADTSVRVQAQDERGARVGFEKSRPGGYRLLMSDNGEDVVVQLDAAAALRVRQQVIAVVADHRARRSSGTMSLFLGAGMPQQADRHGLEVASSRFGEPYRATVAFHVLTPQWGYGPTVELGLDEASRFADGMGKILDIPEPAPAPARPGR